MIRRDDEPDDWGGDDPDDEDECPDCGASIYDDAGRCPRCGHDLSREDAPRRQPWWVVAGALVSLGMVCWWILNP